MAVHHQNRVKGSIREKILDAARELFVEYGYDGVSMRKVAERIKYSPTAIYLHFANKESLFRELCTMDFRALATTLKELSAIADPADRLTACGCAYVDFAAANPNHYRLMFMTSYPRSMPLTNEQLSRRGDVNEDAYAFLLSLVRESMAAGAFREDLNDPELIAQTLWAGAHGVASLEIAMTDDQWIDWRSLSDRRQAMMSALMSWSIRREK